MAVPSRSRGWRTTRRPFSRRRSRASREGTPPPTSAARPGLSLAVVRRVMFQRGETQLLHVWWVRVGLRFWGAQSCRWVVVAGVLDVGVGEAATAPLHAELTVGP